MALIRSLPLIVILVLAGCGGGGGKTTSTATTSTGPVRSLAGCIVVEPPPAATRTAPKPTKPLAANKTYEVTMKTNCGSFTFKLDQVQSPNAAASFVSLVQRHYFDKTIFHRIAVGFVIQGGDPSGLGTGGPGYKTVDTPPSTADYLQGVVAMAKKSTEAPGTAGSQFFVVTADSGLPPDYAIVGSIVKGLDVVEKIGQLGGADESPTETVEIESATVSIT